MQNKTTFLVTAIGSMSADCVLSALRSIPNAYIIGCDLNPKEWIYNVLKTDEFYNLPKASDASYIQKIKKICDALAVDFIIPLTDPEVDVLSEHKTIFGNTKICTSDYESIRTSRNKEKLSNAFINSSITTIPTLTYDALISAPPNWNKIIAKPKKGRSSEGIFTTKNIQEILHRDNDTLKGYIFQPFIQGDIITVDFIRDRMGNSFSVARKELIRTSNGAGLTVEVFEDEHVAELVNKIGETLNIIGCVNMEFLVDNNVYYLMDFNPRFSAGIGFSHLAGAEFVENNILAFQGNKINTHFEISSGIYCKTYTDIKY